MDILSIVNQKGGVGKTTTTYTVASVLCDKGYKVLMIDNDQQGSLTLACGYEPMDYDVTLSDVYLEKHPITDAIYETKIENLHLTPGHISLAKVDTILMGQGARGRNTLAKALAAIDGQYDFVIIDNPPALSFLTINSLCASKYVLAPCPPDPLSIYGLEDLYSTIENAQGLIKFKQENLGVLVTRYKRASKILRENLETMKQNYEICGIVKESAEVFNALSVNLPVTRFKKNCEVSKQYVEATENLLTKMGYEVKND